MKSDAERKTAVIKAIEDAYPQQHEWSVNTIKLFIAALDGIRAEYVERALPIAIKENTFPPTIAHLVAIIEREQWSLKDEHDLTVEHLENNRNYSVSKAELNEWLDEREKERTTTERDA